MKINTDTQEFIKLNGIDNAKLALQLIPTEYMEMPDNENKCVWCFHKQELVIEIQSQLGVIE